MLETLSRHWWAVALRGAAAILFGVLALVWPGITVLALVLLFGAYALVDGAFTLAAAFGNRDGGRTRGDRAWLFARGIAGILTAVIAVVWPGITALALLWVIALWAMVTGVLEIVAAFRLRKEMRHEWLLALSGALSVLFGVLLVVWPAAGVLTLVVLIGIAAIAFGITLLTLGLRLRQARRHDPAAAGQHHRPATT
ncbi:HdeD family acid-resistance protein [Actinoplanes sp. KI2]|uniref:HdeD family acid-resistance protein n=1 Tax=Actinoplanes sp. KI2 TaxID=2983315 RepID=UPI0021D5E124|nr:HdeD family acid-resistance protein [Actinoplanes sp. KI2]MCU7730798.1 HdeD family acid-resistance protein [Actinoplanes sp. KI2]